MFQNKTNNNIFFLLILSMPFTFLIGSFFVNFVAILITFYTLILLVISKRAKIFFDNEYKFLFFLFIIFLISSTLSEYKLTSFENSFSFFSNIILFLALILFFSEKHNEKKIFLLSKFIFYLTLFLCIDLWIQKIYGNSMFGYPKQQAGRLTSIFKDEQIPGGIILKLSIFSIYYLFQNFKNKFLANYKILILLFIYFSIIITGERSSIILASILSFLLIALNFYSIPKKKLATYLSIFLFSFVILFNLKNSLIKERFYYTIEQSKDNIYLQLYNNGFEIFKENIFFGTGPQSYRYECLKNNDICSTHPHNFLIELLSDGGFLSALILIISLFSLLLFKIKKTNSRFLKSIIIAYLIIFFFPLIPTGSFFNSFHMTLTWFSLGFIFSLKKI